MYLGIAIEIWVIAGLMVLAILFLMSMLARLYRKAGPNEALIVYGFRGTRVVQGHGTVIFPMVENCKGLSLELMSFDVAPQQDLYTKQGVAVTVEAVAHLLLHYSHKASKDRKIVPVLVTNEPATPNLLDLNQQEFFPQLSSYWIAPVLRSSWDKLGRLCACPCR